MAFNIAKPYINIDPSEAKKQDVSIALRKLYYRPAGYQKNARKLYEDSRKAGFKFTLDEVQDWLERQAVYQIHKPYPKKKNIPRVSFNTVIKPNKVHQADVLYMPYDKVGRITYLFCLNIKDVASRYGKSIPIGSANVTTREGILTSHTIAEAFKSVYDDPDCPLVWPETLITDKGPEFRGECEKVMREHGVKIQKANSKQSTGIVERYNRTLVEKLFPPQDAINLLKLGNISRVWFKHLPIIEKDLNNSVTRLLGIPPSVAIKEDFVIAEPSMPGNPNEQPLSIDVCLRYLLEPGELEGDKRRRAGDLNWSPKIYHIRDSLKKNNQPILYWLEDGPKRSFVREELMIVPADTELPPQWVLFASHQGL